MEILASFLRSFFSQQALVEFEPASSFLRYGVDRVLLGVEKSPDKPQGDHPLKVVSRGVSVQICRGHYLVSGRRSLDKALEDGSDNVSPRPPPNPMRQGDNTEFAKNDSHVYIL